MYSLLKSTFKLFNSFAELILYWPFPSYPSVQVLRIPGIKSWLDFNSFSFFIETYEVVLILHSLRKSFSVNLFCIILLIFGLGKTFFDWSIFDSVEKGMFSNSKVTKSTLFKNSFIFWSSLYSPQMNSSLKFFAGESMLSQNIIVLIFIFLLLLPTYFPVDRHQ